MDDIQQKFKIKLNFPNTTEKLLKIIKDHPKYDNCCDELGKCLEETLKTYPPKYNYYKMIFGGVCTRLFMSMCSQMNIMFNELGDDEKLNDIEINDLKFSVKTTKTGNDIIILNFRNQSRNIIEIYNEFKTLQIIVIQLKNQKIYFINLSNIIKTIDDFKLYFNVSDANVTMKSSIYSLIDKDYIINIKVNSNIEFDDLDESPYKSLSEQIISKLNLKWSL